MLVRYEARLPFTVKLLGFTAAALMTHVAYSAAGANLPSELAFIADVIDDEKTAVDSIRRFDSAQQALAEWDVETARELELAGDSEGANERLESAQHRISMINEAYGVVLNRYSRNARALNYQGELLYDRLGDPVTAIKNWRLAAAFDDSLSTPHNNLGLHYFHTGSYQMGLRELDKAMERDEDHADYHFNMAQVYLAHAPQIGKIRSWNKKRVYREAMKHSKRAAELARDDYDLQQDYAVNFFAAENLGVDADWKEAAEAWSVARGQARSQTEEFYTWLNEARVWIKEENRGRAEPCLLEALELMPENDVVLRLLEKIRNPGE